MEQLIGKIMNSRRVMSRQRCCAKSCRTKHKNARIENEVAVGIVLCEISKFAGSRRSSDPPNQRANGLRSTDSPPSIPPSPPTSQLPHPYQTIPPRHFLMLHCRSWKKKMKKKKRHHNWFPSPAMSEAEGGTCHFPFAASQFEHNTFCNITLLNTFMNPLAAAQTDLRETIPYSSTSHHRMNQ